MSQPTHTVNQLITLGFIDRRISKIYLRVPVLCALEQRYRDALCEDVENKHTLEQLCFA